MHFGAEFVEELLALSNDGESFMTVERDFETPHGTLDFVLRCAYLEAGTRHEQESVAMHLVPEHRIDADSVLFLANAARAAGCERRILCAASASAEVWQLSLALGVSIYRPIVKREERWGIAYPQLSRQTIQGPQGLSQKEWSQLHLMIEERPKDVMVVDASGQDTLSWYALEQSLSLDEPEFATASLSFPPGTALRLHKGRSLPLQEIVLEYMECFRFWGDQGLLKAWASYLGV